MQHVKNTQYLYLLKKIYIKCNIWRVAVRPSYIWDTRFLKVKGRSFGFLVINVRNHGEHYYYFQLRTAAFKTYCAILVGRSNFRHQASPRVTTREHPAAEGGEKCPRILPKMPNSTLHLGIFTCRKATTSPPKECVLRIFSP